MSGERKRIVIGKVGGPFGVKGWVKLLSWTEPRDGIFEYAPWLLKSGDTWKEWEVAEGHAHGKGVIARFEGVTDRDQAMALMGAEIAVWRDQLGETKPGQYYWADLVGLDVQLEGGRSLGKVQGLMATGSNDVLVVKGERERLIPFIQGQVIMRVDLAQGLIQVDWDPDF
ncbi:MAG TPA: ribosome maturation factor RimM [Gammaproteobacteria bacterium]|nr:ribosome maturation factor RimM [Gammaproteobacteria bacterium]